MAHYAEPRLELQTTAACQFRAASARAAGDSYGVRPLDDKIELNRQMNRTLEELAGALFRAWFVDFEPVVAKAAGRAPFGLAPAVAALFPAAFTDSELGPIPLGWRVGCIADLARYVNGRAFTKGATGTGRMVIRIAELNSGPGGSTVYHDIAAAPENIAHPGDLLFAWSGSLDVYRWHRDEALVNQHIFKVICDAYPPVVRASCAARGDAVLSGCRRRQSDNDGPYQARASFRGEARTAARRTHHRR